MARIRTLKPEHRQHRKVGALPHFHYRLWVGMICEADDEGRLICDAGQLRVLIFGYHLRTRTGQVEEAIQDLSSLGLIRLYDGDGTRYADFPSWKDHQRLDHPTPSKLPAWEPSRTVREDSASAREDSRGIKDQGSRIKDRIKEGSAELALAGAAGVAPWKLADTISTPLGKTRFAGLAADERWWRAQFKAHNGTAFAKEVLEAEAWCASNPGRAPKTNYRRFLNSWFQRAGSEQ